MKDHDHALPSFFQYINTVFDFRSHLEHLKDGRREPFSRDKIIGGIKKACQKRPVSITKIEEFADAVELYFQELGKKEIDSKEIGERVINRLKEWDEVAYVRFASVYRQFRDINEFMSELEGILKARKEKEGTKKTVPAA